MSSVFERRLIARVENELGSGLVRFTPGFVIQVVHRGKLIADLGFGTTHTYYDLASLTKIVFTTSVYMGLVARQEIELGARIGAWLPDFAGRDVTLRQLLTHTAGLPWWRPFHRGLARRGSWHERWRRLRPRVARLRPQFSGAAVYSDVDFFVLGYLLEAVTEMSLLENWREHQELWGLARTRFHPANRPSEARALYAPTEKSLWRGKVLRGEVHDDNTWALGGVAAHAGLFGPIDDVTRWGRLVRQALRGEKAGRVLAPPDVVRQFTRRAIPRSVGDWGLGFMKPTHGRASCGRHFSSQSFGHTGFTGTSFWCDPRRDLMVTILANRVHPSRRNKKFVTLRPLLHDWVCESLE